MGNDELFIINHLKSLGAKDQVEEALKMTTDDIKFNRIRFGKKTGKYEFMQIFTTSLNVLTRCSEDSKRLEI